jgi:apolipoprotein N-acyltransferase
MASFLFLPFLSGLLLCLSIPSFLNRSFAAWPGWLAWFALVPLLAGLKGAGVRQAFWKGAVTGFVFFVGSLYWISYVKPMGTLAPLGWILLSTYLALFHGAFAALTCQGLRQDRPWAVLWIPALWTLLEALRGWLLTGFPWEGLGYSQYRNQAVLPLAASCGVYGLHYLVCLGNVILFSMGWGERGLAAGKMKWQAAGALAVLGLCGWAGRFQEEPAAAKIKVAVIQGNINQDQEWTPEYRRSLMAGYRRLMEASLAQGARLMVWPEGTFPGLYSQSPRESGELAAFASKNKVDLLLGADNFDPPAQYSNSAILLGADGGFQEYRKQHLVPFGEFVPFRTLLPFVDKAVQRFGLVDFSPGSAPAAFRTQGGKAAPLICYEGIFPELAARAVGLGANLLVVITFDTWYGDSAAPYQHVSQAVLRAVENRRWLARAGATGISCFISPQGEILDPIALDTEGTAVRDLTLYTGRTPYQRWGNWFLVLCGLIFFLAWLRPARQRPKRG